MNKQSPDDQARDNPVSVSSKQRLLRIESNLLFKGAQEIIIDHMGQEYHLRLTSQGKLLLTK